MIGPWPPVAPPVGPEAARASSRRSSAPVASARAAARVRASAPGPGGWRRSDGARSDVAFFSRPFNGPPDLTCKSKVCTFDELHVGKQTTRSWGCLVKSFGSSIDVRAPTASRHLARIRSRAPHPAFACVVLRLNVSFRLQQLLDHVGMSKLHRQMQRPSACGALRGERSARAPARSVCAVCAGEEPGRLAPCVWDITLVLVGEPGKKKQVRGQNSFQE